MISKFLRGIAIAAVVCASAAPAKTVGRVGDWTIDDLGDGCMMYGSYNGGTVFSVVTDSKDDDLLFTLQNKKWTSVKDAAIYKIKVEFDKRGKWDMTAVGTTTFDNDGPGISWFGSYTTNAQGDNFVGEFMVGSGIRVTKDGVEIAALALPDTKEASFSLARCARKYRATADPFRNMKPDTAPNDDPFRT